MRSVGILAMGLLLLATGCTSGGADRWTSDPCHAGGALQCHDMFEQNKGGRNNGGMGRGGGMGM